MIVGFVEAKLGDRRGVARAASASGGRDADETRAAEQRRQVRRRARRSCGGGGVKRRKCGGRRGGGGPRRHTVAERTAKADGPTVVRRDHVHVQEPDVRRRTAQVLLAPAAILEAENEGFVRCTGLASAGREGQIAGQHVHAAQHDVKSGVHHVPPTVRKPERRTSEAADSPAAVHVHQREVKIAGGRVGRLGAGHFPPRAIVVKERLPLPANRPASFGVHHFDADQQPRARAGHWGPAAVLEVRHAHLLPAAPARANSPAFGWAQQLNVVQAVAWRALDRPDAAGADRQEHRARRPPQLVPDRPALGLRQHADGHQVHVPVSAGRLPRAVTEHQHLARPIDR